MESNNVDCGIDGEDSAPVTHREHNRFIGRVLIGHIRPMHKKLTDLDNWNKNAEHLMAHIQPMHDKLNAIEAWNKNADLMMSRAQGAWFAIKLLVFVIFFAVSATFATTMYVAVELYKQIPTSVGSGSGSERQ